MTTIAARFLPARRADLAPEHLPRIPAWWPLQPTDRRMAESERQHARLLRAQAEAVQGPIDGQTGTVELDSAGPPARFVPLTAPGLSYRLCVRESTAKVAVYRYDPSAPGHRAMMAGVEQAFTEAGPEYVQTAREESDDDRTAPDPARFAPTFAAPEEW